MARKALTLYVANLHAKKKLNNFQVFTNSPERNNKRDRIMRSKSFEKQEVREIGWKKAGKLKSFAILLMRMIEDIFQIKGKESKDHERLKM